jgi:hypothetical protein
VYLAPHIRGLFVAVCYNAASAAATNTPAWPTLVLTTSHHHHHDQLSIN